MALLFIANILPRLTLLIANTPYWVHSGQSIEFGLKGGGFWLMIIWSCMGQPLLLTM